MMITSWLLQNFDGLYVLAQVATDAPVATSNPLVSLFSLISYLFSSFCFWKIYEKLGENNAWFAWVPFLNVWKMYQAGGQSPWWLIGLFIPLVNIAAIVFLIMAMIKIVQRLGKNPWLILLMLIPLANFWVMYHFAFQ
jgi:Family of unknown function (DUF5684)